MVELGQDDNLVKRSKATRVRIWMHGWMGGKPGRPLRIHPSSAGDPLFKLRNSRRVVGPSSAVTSIIRR